MDSHRIDPSEQRRFGGLVSDLSAALHTYSPADHPAYSAMHPPLGYQDPRRFYQPSAFSSLPHKVTALLGVYSGPKMLFLEGMVAAGTSVLTDREGGSDKRTVTIESCPGGLASTGDSITFGVLEGEPTLGEDSFFGPSSGLESITRDSQFV